MDTPALPLSMADISKDDDEVVLERIMANGTFDELRKQLLEDLRTDAELQHMVEERIRGSEQLRQAALDGADEKELFDQLRQDEDLERHVTEMMLRKVWQSTSSQESPIAAAIQHNVHETLCAVYEEREHGVQQQQHQHQQR